MRLMEHEKELVSKYTESTPRVFDELKDKLDELKRHLRGKDRRMTDYLLATAIWLFILETPIEELADLIRPYVPKAKEELEGAGRKKKPAPLKDRGKKGSSAKDKSNTKRRNGSK